MWLKWLPWRYVVRRAARAHGFLDPVAMLSRLHQFAQPSEVNVPIELLRAGVVFHARGLINSRAIQHNLDWVWPYWVERQFDPHDDAFVPRAFSITHVNLTHRNWTAVGVPEIDWYPLVDPRGLVTPHFDGWSLDFWIVPDQGAPLLPSRCQEAEQRLLAGDRLAVETKLAANGGQLQQLVEVIWQDGQPQCCINLSAQHSLPGWLAVAVRPTNPEGVSFIHNISWQSPDTLIVARNQSVTLSRHPDRVCMSHYHRGDVFQDIEFRDAVETSHVQQIRCDVGMATAAALYRLPAGTPVDLSIHIPAQDFVSATDTVGGSPVPKDTSNSWSQLTRDTCQLQTPDQQFNRLFAAAVQSLLLHTTVDVFPGPYTYKRFWFRDAAFILNALLVLGHLDRVKGLLALFPSRQTRSGYFRSQDGEWDSNGAALWIMDRFRQLSGQVLPAEWLNSIRNGAAWIQRKRGDPASDTPYAGLMPSGFSAEHLGTNDYYYWDDFWSVAGLNSAANTLRAAHQQDLAHEFSDNASSLLQCIDRSIEQTASYRDRKGIPASPHRRMDSGAVGSLAAGYPLQLWDAGDWRLLDTANFLMQACTVDGGFFQDMIHSGINAYLTLHLAQVFLRAGDPRHFGLTRTVADLASPTGQWPEAIHPRTHGGCMGDGQHVWAAAEWVMMMRNYFVREEGQRLVLFSGIPESWLESDHPIRFGPTPTSYGPVTIEWDPRQPTEVRCLANWRVTPPEIEVPEEHPLNAVTVSH